MFFSFENICGLGYDENAGECSITYYTFDRLLINNIYIDVFFFFNPGFYVERFFSAQT